MTKRIVLSNNVVKYMTFEEILVQFNPMINKFANRAVAQSEFNKPDLEDILQELKFQTWEAYKRYNGVNAFSTYLVPRLKLGVHQATQKLYAQKRNNKNGATISLNQAATSLYEGGEKELEELFGVEDVELLSVEFSNLLLEIEKNLDAQEKLMLKVMLDKNDFSIRDLGDALGISRQGANKKYLKFKEKMKQILIDSGYSAC